ncbi:EthD family reductase [Mycolicibacterium goodii]|uniref:EthD domain-containing protein n=1 Tax=Mycolicibacterium goodii TaxID=134601 RepID=A0ABS6HY33_MYCGD|nr:EthD family reductase [Mycolicibacterium goodii]MBU8827133.1 EthD domain-containing protein [Mycolicibacterium goodii]MBU8835025.1 EthD domain-containing protein [Mycolicibacterium goodii]OKH61733.1 ethyl tert-butyl ether degradation protein EthD [Mycobacterium sp. SWH-M5]
MTMMLVHYVGNNHSRFDRDYYVAHHLPLVERTWGPYGLRSAEAYFAEDIGDADGIVAICLCHFEDRDAMVRALSAPETAAVMDDVAQFTDITPMRTVMARGGKTRTTS